MNHTEEEVKELEHLREYYNRDKVRHIKKINKSFECLDIGSVLLLLRDVTLNEHNNLEKIASEVGITREAMYKILVKNGNPSIRLFIKIIDQLGLTINLSRKS